MTSWRLAALAFCALVGLAPATAAQANWKRAESRHFVVYSEGNETALRRYVRNLEIYDLILRARMGLPTNAPVARKLPIYLVQNRAGIDAIRPGTSSTSAGAYAPSNEDIFAFAIQTGEQDYLLHEYFHHFMLQMPTTSHYPGWMVEGLAEYFMTANITPERVEIGEANENRAYMLLASKWLPLETLLSQRAGQLTRQSDKETYYPVAWALTHWFMSDETRRLQLIAYTDAIRGGADPVSAMQQVTGLTIDEIDRELKRYIGRGRLPAVRYNFDFPDAEITVTTLPDSMDDLLLIGQRLKIGVAEEKRPEQAVLVRRLAAEHPGDSFAELQLGHAELHFGDAAQGEAVLTRLIERDPSALEARQLLAGYLIRKANEEGAERTALLRRARSLLAQAYALDSGDYRTLLWLAKLREGAADYPTENDLVIWSQAFAAAPQLSEIRLGYAAGLIEAGERDDAVILLEPLANAPHGRGASDLAKELIERARSGGAAPTADEIDAATEEESEPAPPQPAGEPAPTDGSPVTSPEA